MTDIIIFTVLYLLLGPWVALSVCAVMFLIVYGAE